MPGLAEAREVLKDSFGFSAFRRGQKRIIRRLLEGRSVLAVLPTSGGKSLCYQLPALLLDGLTIVICPLIALMKDQVDFLAARGIAAARLDSSLDDDQARQVHDDLRSGRLKLLYVSPERLASESFLHLLAGREISFLAVDEAHCIYEWGHNFRPEYLKLARLADELCVGRVLALTATATPQVTRGIADAFGIADGDIIESSFHRENLELHVTPCRPEDRRRLLLSRLRARPAGPTIVYVTQQRTAEEVAGYLAGKGLGVSAYHAGLGKDERHRIQDAFMASGSMVVVATIAFGMGIDKANIRHVYHYNLAKSLEHYSQEIGRAGRDGRPADCELFACDADAVVLENFSHGDTPGPEAIDAVVRDVLGRGSEFDVSIHALSKAYDMRLVVVRTLLAYLELDGILQPTGSSYAEYRFRLERPLAKVLKHLDTELCQLARQIFDAARPGSRWQTLNVAEAGGRIEVPRTRIVAVLTGLESLGHLTLEAKGARQGYRRLRARIKVNGLCRSVAARFREQEEADVARVNDVLEFAQSEECLTRSLLSHFGEELEEDCGHCDRCRGTGQAPVAATPVRGPSAAEKRMLRTLISEGYESLESPRQLARFLCGLPSPASNSAGLNLDTRYGAMAEMRFTEVLRLVERLLRSGRSGSPTAGRLRGS